MSALKRIFENDAMTDSINLIETVESVQSIAMGLGSLVPLAFPTLRPRRLYQFPGGAYQLNMYVQQISIYGSMAGWTGVLKVYLNINGKRTLVEMYEVTADFVVNHKLYSIIEIPQSETVRPAIEFVTLTSSGSPTADFTVAMNYGFLYTVAEEPVKHAITIAKECQNCGYSE